MTFNDFNLSPSLLKALAEKGYEQPTPIQQKAIPLVLQEHDLIGCAQTGTGKTAAFALPLLQLLLNKPKTARTRKAIEVLVLTPTRELALQIDENFQDYGKYTPLAHTVIFGGVSQQKQVQAIKKGIDILIATPGRLLDLIQQQLVSLSQVQHLVLDEADRMLDMGFIQDIKKVLRLLPETHHTLLFSATLPPEIEKLSRSILQNPERVAVTPVSSTAEGISQTVYLVAKEDKPAFLASLIKKHNIEQVLVFSRTKHGADRIAKKLNKSGFQADALHGDKSQNARQRALENFKSGKLQVLVATDIASRGIDIEDLPCVINYDLPETGETYIHRIGRTGRQEKSGIAYSFCAPEEEDQLKDILKLIKQPLPIKNEQGETVDFKYRQSPVRKMPARQQHKNAHPMHAHFQQKAKALKK